jgi:hypothetical protein
MPQNLRLDLQYMPHPYPEWAGHVYQAWGVLTLSILHDNIKEVLLKFDWNMVEFIDWYLEYHDEISSMALPGAVLDGESLSQAADRIYDDDEQLDRISRYLRSHELQIPFSDTIIPNIVIGLKDGAGEVSLNDPIGRYNHPNKDFFKRGVWAFPFDMEDFHAHLKSQIQDFLTIWIEKASVPEFRETLEDLLARAKQI